MIYVNADPAAPVTQGAKDSQELDKTPTPPPQDTPAIQGLQEGELDAGIPLALQCMLSVHLV